MGYRYCMYAEQRPFKTFVRQRHMHTKIDIGIPVLPVDDMHDGFLAILCTLQQPLLHLLLGSSGGSSSWCWSSCSNSSGRGS